MKRSTDRILTTHTGSLPRPPDLTRLYARRSRGQPVDEAALAAADCVVVATDHKGYDWAWVARHSRLIVDTRNATRGVADPAARIVKL